MAACSVDSVVTDPPYHLTTGKKGGTGPASMSTKTPHGRARITTGFMGKSWDGGDIAFRPETWAEVLRVAKPGAHLLAFGGTRTFHRLAVAIEDAGWEIRDTLMWVYGSGFPKSLDVSKAIDKAAGAEREVVGRVAGMGKQNPEWNGTSQGRAENSFKPEYDETIPATDAARQWQGWGTALKPAWEPIIVARKPLEGTVAANVQKWGTGAVNVDGCRVGTESLEYRTTSYRDASSGEFSGQGQANHTTGSKSVQGRFPANLIHDGSDEVVGLFPQSKSTGGANGGKLGQSVYGSFKNESLAANAGGLGDSGSAARFFYCAKASRSDRGDGNTHPTVKPHALMRYLCRLVTPTRGVVLDPFTGSGSTGKAAIVEGFRFLGIELDEESCKTAQSRIDAVTPSQPALFG